MKGYDSFEIAMLIKEIYSNTMGIVSESLKGKWINASTNNDN